MAGWFIRRFYSRICDEIAVFLNNFVFVLMHLRVFLRDQPYGVVIFTGLRGSVDALRQHCPTKRLTPMGLSAGENARGLCDFRRNIGHIPQRVYMGVRKKHANKPLGFGLLVEQG